MNEASERTKKWLKEHPEQCKASRMKSKEKKVRLRLESLKVIKRAKNKTSGKAISCLLYTSPSPRDRQRSRMPSSA